MPASSTSPDFRHWTDYWSTGALTSLPQDFAANYDGEVAEFWSTRFAPLPDQARILDLCTGNGPIALLAASFSRQHGRDLQITAVDAAAIEPDRLAQQWPAAAELIARIEFRGNVLIESLPIDDGQIDLATSQYGLEYCRLDQAAGEIFRVLKPGGRLVMLCHSADSDMIRTMSAEQRDYELLADSGFLKLLYHCEKAQLAAADLPRRVRRPAREIQARQQASGSPLLAQALNALSGLAGMSAAQLRDSGPQIGTFRARLIAGKQRLEDMLRVNRMIDEDRQWHQPLIDAGLVLEARGELVYRKENHMGDYFEFRKPA